MSLSGKTFIMTGASSGIGAAAAQLFAQAGANLILAARRRDRLEAVASSLPAEGGSAVAVAGDVQDEGYNELLVKTAVSEFGCLHGAFNNAGTLGELGPVPQMTAQTWSQVLAVNLTSGFYAAKYQIPAIKAAGGGAVVFTSSFVGNGIGLAGMGAYAASKAGLVGLTQVLASEHGGDGIRVNAIMPGGTKTEMAGNDASFHDQVAAMHALKRMATPQEIAEVAKFLLSDAASFITGSTLYCDGGNSIHKG